MVVTTSHINRADFFDIALAKEAATLARSIANLTDYSGTYVDERIAIDVGTYNLTVEIITGSKPNHEGGTSPTVTLVLRQPMDAQWGYADEFHPGKWIDYLRALLPRLERERDERVRREEEAARAELVARFTPVGAELDALFAEGGE